MEHGAVSLVATTPAPPFNATLEAFELDKKKYGFAVKHLLCTDLFISAGYSREWEEYRPAENRTKETYTIGLEHRL